MIERPSYWSFSLSVRRWIERLGFGVADVIMELSYCETDGCSSAAARAFDGWMGGIWRPCCVLHDALLPLSNGRFRGDLAADFVFLVAMVSEALRAPSLAKTAVALIAALIWFLAVVIFGSIPRAFRRFIGRVRSGR